MTDIKITNEKTLLIDTIEQLLKHVEPKDKDNFIKTLITEAVMKNEKFMVEKTTDLWNTFKSKNTKPIPRTLAERFSSPEYS